MYEADVADRYARELSTGEHEKAVMSYPPQRHLANQVTLQRQTAALLRSITGKQVTEEWAGKVIRHVLTGRNPADPWRYIRGAILSAGDPEREFLPITAPGYYDPDEMRRRHARTT